MSVIQWFSSNPKELSHHDISRFFHVIAQVTEQADVHTYFLFHGVAMEDLMVAHLLEWNRLREN